MTPPNCVKVKRDGPRGWHYIAKAHYDPAVHVIVEDDMPQQEQSAPAAEAEPPPVKRGPGRPRKNPII